MRLLTVAEAAQRLRVSKSTLYALLHAGRIPFVTVGRKKGYRFAEEDLDEFVGCNRKLVQVRETPKRQRKFKHLKL